MGQHGSRTTGAGRRRSIALATGLAIGAAGGVTLVHLLTQRRGGGTTYPPLDTLKPLAAGIWTVDSGPISAAGLKLPVRMTVVRLPEGDLFLHSPTRFTPGLARELEAIGTVRHLIAPTFAHWTFLKAWQAAYPGATTWAAPGLRDRGPVRRSGVRFDRDLGPSAPAAWGNELQQIVVPGAAGFREVGFFHEASGTLLLADLVQNLDVDELNAPTALMMGLAGATRATTPFYLRALLTLRRAEAAAAVSALIAFAPARVVFAHGHFFARAGTEQLRAAFAWLLRPGREAPAAT